MKYGNGSKFDGKHDAARKRAHSDATGGHKAPEKLDADSSGRHFTKHAMRTHEKNVGPAGGPASVMRGGIRM